MKNTVIKTNPLVARICIGLIAIVYHNAWADDDFIVYSPHVAAGQNEVETRGFFMRDPRYALNGASGFETSVAHTFNDWWKVELYTTEYNATPGVGHQFSGQELENTFQLTDVGEYWADTGFLASYLKNHLPGMPDGVEFGPLFEKQTGPIIQRLNLIWQKDMGGGATMRYQFRSAYSLGYQINRSFAPGLEAYYRPADLSHQIGPAFSGEIRLGKPGQELEYSTALVYGVNEGAPDRTFIVRIAYEFF